MDRVEIVDSFREELYVALLSDVLDELGRTEQALPAHIRPVDPKRRLAGFARTGLYREIYVADPTRNAYELEIALVDDLKHAERSQKRITRTREETTKQLREATVGIDQVDAAMGLAYR